MTTATSGERCLVDTNVFVVATDTSASGYANARRFLLREPAPWTSAQVVREYLVVATRPVVARGLGLGVDDALANLRSFRGMVRLVKEERPVLPVLLALLASVPVTGKRIHDANLVATAMAHRIERIVTLNVGDFAPFRAHVRAVAP